MTDITTVNENNIEDILREIESTYWEIPFGNTDFQCENFVIAAAITPERAFRTIGLQLHNLLTTLRQVKHDQKLLDIEIEELQEKISDSNTNKFERKRAQAKLDLITDSRTWNQKLVLDTIRQLEVYYKHYRAFPKYTRDQFEKAEQTYFEQSQRRLLLGITGAKESIMNMVDDKQTIEKFEKMYAELPVDQKEQMIEQISRAALSGLIEFKQGEENEIHRG